jgi:hypothetical protein
MNIPIDPVAKARFQEINWKYDLKRGLVIYVQPRNRKAYYRYKDMKKR